MAWLELLPLDAHAPTGYDQRMDHDCDEHGHIWVLGDAKCVFCGTPYNESSMLIPTVDGDEVAISGSDGVSGVLRAA